MGQQQQAVVADLPQVIVGVLDQVLDVGICGVLLCEAQDTEVMALVSKEVVALRYLRLQAIPGALVGVRTRSDA